MSRFTTGIAAFLFALGMHSELRADPLYSKEFTETFVVLAGADPGVQNLLIGSSPKELYGFDDLATPLFNVNFARTDAGKTFTANASTTGFSYNVDLLTNGQNDRFIVYGQNAWGGRAYYEASVFYGAPHYPAAETGPLDLKGITLSGVTLTLTDYSKTGATYDAHSDLNLDWYSFKYQLTFDGQGELPVNTSPGGEPGGEPGGAGSPAESPEPFSFGLAGLGILSIMGWRRLSRPPYRSIPDTF